MTAFMQLCDADLGGNLDNKHSQTSYLGYLAGSVICWCNIDQGSVSTSTAESEIKAVNHTLKAEIIANRGILNMMGWKQSAAVIEEDSSSSERTSHHPRTETSRSSPTISEGEDAGWNLLGCQGRVS
jgi:hypothetical protein